MTEDEILAEIAIVSQTIADILQAGEEYEVESGPSRRRTRFSKLPELRSYRSGLYAQLESINGNDALVLSI